MIYFGNPSTDVIRQAMQRGEYGCIITPKQNLQVPDGVIWCADNGRFGKGWTNLDHWLAMVQTSAPASLCMFAVAPDVPGDAIATARESTPVLPMIRALGVPAAYAAQDGIMATVDRLPWDEFDVLFLGGTDEFKVGPEGEAISRLARERGKWVHMGRVNSMKRLRVAYQYGCTSVDGTYLKFGPSKNVVRMRRFLDTVAAEFDHPARQHVAQLAAAARR